jgi:hypothetical protein
MVSENRKEKDKHIYEKPRLRVIELAAEEVMAVGCKTNPADFSGAGGAGCTNAACSITPGS